MTQEDTLALILTAACPHILEDGWNEYFIKLHCTTVRIEARVAPKASHSHYVNYEVRECEIVM